MVRLLLLWSVRTIDIMTQPADMKNKIYTIEQTFPVFFNNIYIKIEVNPAY